MFNYENKTQKYINQEIDTRLGELSAKGLIRSEEEYRNAIQKIADDIQVDANRITSSTKHLAVPDTTVSSQNLNELFMNLEADVRILHQELGSAHRILDMSLARNMAFYRRIKNKLAAMWKDISYYRETSFSKESADYTFFESFSSEDSSMSISGLTIDKKTGEIHLAPASVKINNKSKDIQEVEVKIYPPDNKGGGVFETTNPANKAPDNYDTGDRQILKNGLWKVQLLTADIPATVIDPIGRGSTGTYNGVLVYLDILFTGQKTLNELAIDPYGEFPTKVLGVRYKRTLDSTVWETATTTDELNISTPVTGEGSDVVYIRNINPIIARRLRIILHQENHIIVSKLLSKVDDMVNKMVKDIEERRYSKLEYKYKYVDDLPRVSDINKDRGTLYDEVMDAIEEGGSLDELEGRVKDLLIPKPLEIHQDIRNWKLYNVGAWSVEPKTVWYPPAARGIYISHDTRNTDSGFRFGAGAPTEATLYTRQTEPKGTLIEWYLLADNSTDTPIEIPIIPNNDTVKTEIARVGNYYPLANIKAANTFRTTTDMRNVSKLIKLDFPVHPAYVSEIVILENGKEIVNENSINLDTTGRMIELYNSTELYISNMELQGGCTYAIKYTPALIDTVRCWTLVPSNEPREGFIDLGSAMVFAEENYAKAIAGLLPTIDVNGDNAPIHVTKSPKYEVQAHLCTKEEYDTWFLGGRVPAFVDKCVDNNISAEVEWLRGFMAPYNKHNSMITKLTWLYELTSPIKPYSDDLTDAYTWNELPSAPPLLNQASKQYEVANA